MNYLDGYYTGLRDGFRRGIAASLAVVGILLSLVAIVATIIVVK